jgi:hypothetical protein
MDGGGDVWLWLMVQVIWRDLRYLMLVGFGRKCLMYKGFLALQHVFWEAGKSVRMIHGIFGSQRDVCKAYMGCARSW